MDNYLHLDFESRSSVSLEDRGLYNYVSDKSTEVLMLAYALGAGEARLWQPHLSGMPTELCDLLADPFTVKCAWNASFERGIFNHVLGLDIPLDEWIDPTIWARHVSLPGYLEDCGEVLGIPKNLAKMAEGEDLIQKFCLPVCEARETLFGYEQPVFRDWNTDPEDWVKFTEYCKNDVVAEREILRRLKDFPLPAIEQKGWELDQRINERGIYTDKELVKNALILAEGEKQELTEKMRAITNLENPNSRDQILGWARTQGYPFHSMGKVWVQRALDSGCLTEPCKEVFLMRQQAAKTSWAKFETLQQQVCADGRIRHQFSFLGASRTGRWRAGGVQLHNLPQGSKEIKKSLETVVQDLRSGDIRTLKNKFPNVMDVVSACIRPAFRAKPDHTLYISDLNAIETRGGAYIARCPSLLNVFAQGLDPYIDFASKMYKQTYASLEAKGKDSPQRQVGKAATLGCIYRLGGGDDSRDRFGNPSKTGLYGFAANMGVHRPKEEWADIVKAYREAYPEIVQCWYDLENAGIRIVQRGAKSVQVGPLYFDLHKQVLMLHLPSGRTLHYIDPQVEMREFFGKMKPTLSYMGKDPLTKQWVRIYTHGGHILENADQGFARDVLLNGMFLAENAGYPIVLHCHDELVAEVHKQSPLTLAGLEDCMATSPAWALDLPLKAEGFISEYYKK